MSGIAAMHRRSPTLSDPTPVIALHCSGSGAGQWRALGEALDARHGLVTPEHYGCESVGPWTGAHAFTLADEAARTIEAIDRSDWKVHLVGHSYGSMTGFIEASRYQDVDALVLTGVSHNITEVKTPTNIESKHYPAVLDPQFRGTIFDPGYVTSRPGTRYDLFYAPATDVDPRIVERDEATKGSFSQSEIMNYLVIFRTRLDIRVPVFLLIVLKVGAISSLF